MPLAQRLGAPRMSAFVLDGPIADRVIDPWFSAGRYLAAFVEKWRCCVDAEWRCHCPEGGRAFAAYPRCACGIPRSLANSPLT